MATKRQRIQIQSESLIESFKEIEGLYRKQSDKEKEIAQLQELRADRQQVINELQRNYNLLTSDQKDELDRLIVAQNEQYVTLRNLTKEQKNYNDQVQKQKKLQASLVGIAEKMYMWLNEQDKAIRSTILNLGLSGAKAAAMRSTFEKSSIEIFSMGGNLTDVQNIMEGFADVTGNAQVLTADMVQSIEAIARGTGLGVEQATRLAAQFEFMGIDVRNSLTMVQGIVDTSERMGVNTTKVLRTVTDNFKKLSSFTFQGGVKAMAQMAISAEKTRVSMATALNVAEATRGLEQVIELGANLQVMGGEFAKMDPFTWLYTVRNEPDKLNDKISEMTRGLYTLRKTAAGTFEAFISPEDRDRMAVVAKQLHMTTEELAEIGQRRLALDKLSGTLKGLGFSKEQQEWVAGAAKLNQLTGQYMVMVAGNLVNVRDLTKEQAQSFVQEQKTLKARAEEALTFDEALTATINEFKSILLPALRGFNDVLKTARPIFENLAKWLQGKTFSDIGFTLLKWTGYAILAMKFMGGITSSLVGGITRLAGLGLGKLFPSMGKIFSRGGGTSGAGGTFGAGAGAGVKALGAGAGIGLAAAGTGAGIMLAAKGLTELATAMSKLTPEQASALKAIGMTLAITFPAAAIGIALAGKAATAGAEGIAILSVAALAMGFSIKMAASGIGQMAEGLGNLVEKAKGSGWQLAQIGIGIAAINAAMATSLVGRVGGWLGGYANLSKVLSIISENADGLTRVGDAFKNISTVLTGNKEDFLAVQNAVESIAKVNVKGGGMLAELATLLKSPLKVEFADKNVSLVNDITLNIDGEKFMQKVVNVSTIIQKTNYLKEGREASKPVG